jgi:uncharacterized protein YcfL
MRIPLYVLAFGAISFVLAGCHHTVNTVEVGTASSAAGEYRWIQTDERLSEIASVVSARKTKADDLLKVQVELMNHHSKPRKFYYRFEWLEADGMMVESPTPIWMLRTILPKETILLQAVAPNPRVADCRLKLQEDVK